jgi:hypothetical protein
MNSATSITPLSTGFSGTQFATFNSCGINDAEGPDKFNIYRIVIAMIICILFSAKVMISL